MIILRDNYYSRIQDEDYMTYQNSRIHDVRHAKRNNAIALGLGGGLFGGEVGYLIGKKHPGRAALIGAGVGTAAGGLIGHHIGKKIKRDTERDATYRKDRYKKASESDRKYLRKKLQEERDQELKERQARAQEMQAIAQNQIAWNTF